MNKSEIRKAIKARKAQLTAQEKAKAAADALMRLEQCPAFVNAKHLLVYASLPDEISTEALLNKWYGSKHLYLPRIKDDTLEILEYHPGGTHRGAFQIDEPNGENIADVKILDAIIVPAVAYDLKGNRLGRGKGFYDRLLSTVSCPKIGFIYDLQLLGTIPAEAHDIPVDYIITDKQTIQI